VFRFEKLDVWTKSIAFANCVYEVTKCFPDQERFGLTAQMRRSAISVSSNIAEGSGRGTDKDFSRFVEIAYGSLLECISQAHIAFQQGFLTNEDFEKMHCLADELARMLSGLRSSLNR
jgi:four helix bundle protein